MTSTAAPAASQIRRKFQEDLLALIANQQETLLFVTRSIEDAVCVSDVFALLSQRPNRATSCTDADAIGDLDAEMV